MLRKRPGKGNSAYGNGMSIHKESNLFVYWQMRGGGTGSGLYPIINQSLGHVVTD